MSQTLKTSIDIGVVVKDDPRVLGGIGEKLSNNGTQWYQQDRIYDDNVAISVTIVCNPYYKSNLRIRKLTPKECFRLMGVKDEDYENIDKHQSVNKLYHLAGDSIVVDVLMAIFKEMI
jgi:DNA (cytosine-5)-methyltransferase 1